MLDRFKERPLSHSQLSSWEYSPEQWYTSYWLGQRQPPTPEMLAGSRIGDSIGTDESLVPDLVPPGVKEFEMRAEWNGIPLVGYADHYCPDTFILSENKTSPNKSRWTQKKTDEHKQMTMYAFLLNLMDGTRPEDVTMYLNFIPLKLVGVTYQPSGNWKQFETYRTKADIEAYKDYIMDTVEAMNEYAMKRDALSTGKRSAPVFNGV